MVLLSLHLSLAENRLILVQLREKVDKQEGEEDWLS